MFAVGPAAVSARLPRDPHHAGIQQHRPDHDRDHPHRKRGGFAQAEGRTRAINQRTPRRSHGQPVKTCERKHDQREIGFEGSLQSQLSLVKKISIGGCRMALIECKDCSNEISDSAVSCPKCGAPVPRGINPNAEPCPFCATLISEDATVCPSCRAVQGFLYTENQGALGKGGTIFFISVFAIPGLFFPMVGLFTIPVALYGTYRLVTGPRWFQSRHAG